ncbi:hypothetical protein DFA_04888 [Cavenderia fasciculata]|uniref:Uncharacterized protein n=1 Tax=Cavenderia fasciculata TaxID=261658 RepID=F4PMA8_CACFS|nr:uncharacterized protein DFA_04888 [Cavenderia fasciculata]EGG22758.1 hypothetical protein DFA_04888 [Cavenderia fasciculata]|eukprot:XP_004360609.1 hypothetical protein DFA_04888 [Cavenderia fasciculata]
MIDRLYKKRTVVRAIYTVLIVLAAILFTTTLYIETQVIANYKESHINNDRNQLRYSKVFRSVVQGGKEEEDPHGENGKQSLRYRASIFSNLSKFNQLHSESRLQEGLKTKPRSEIVETMTNYRHVLGHSSHLEYLIRDDYNVEDQRRIMNGQEYPIIYNFKSPFENIPFYIVEDIGRIIIQPKPIFKTIPLRINIQVPTMTSISQHQDDIHEKDKEELEKRTKREFNLANYQELAKVRDSLPMIDHGLFEYVGNSSDYILTSFLAAMSPKIRKSIIIVGHNTNFDKPNKILDQFLRENKAWDLDKNNFYVPVEKDRVPDYAFIAKLIKVPLSSPTFALYQQLDRINWGYSELNWMYSHASSPTNHPPTCEQGKYLVHTLDASASFGSIVNYLTSAVTQSILLNRALLLDSKHFIFGQWSNTFLPTTLCDENTYHPINNSNSQVYRIEDQDLGKKYLMFNPDDEKTENYPMQFGFNSYFEYEAAVFNWLFRFNEKARLASTLLQYKFYQGKKAYMNPPQCVSLHYATFSPIDNKTNSFIKEKQVKFKNLNQQDSSTDNEGLAGQTIEFVSLPKIIDDTLEALQVVKSMDEFKDIPVLFVMTNRIEFLKQIAPIIDRVTKRITGNKQKMGEKLFDSLSALDHNRDKSNLENLTSGTMTDAQLSEQAIIFFTEMQIAAQCEIIVGSKESSVSRAIKQLSITKFNRPMFFYSID